MKTDFPRSRWIVLFFLLSTFLINPYSLGCLGYVYDNFPSSIHPWPMFHGNRNHTGYANVAGPTSANLKWRFLTAGSGANTTVTSVAISATGLIYVAAPGGLYALNRSGNQVWFNSTYTSAQGPALSETGDRVFFDSSKTIVSLNATTGNTLWTYLTGNSVIFGPTLALDGTVFQGSWDKNFYALNQDTGATIWQYQTAGCLSYPPTIDANGAIYQGGGDAHCGTDPLLYSFTQGGQLRWTYDTGSSIGILRVGSPAILNNGFIAVPASPKLVVLNSDGQLQWSLGDLNTTITGIITPAVAADGTIYTTNGNGVVRAINPDTHAVKWTYQAGSVGLPTFPIVDKNGTVYVGSDNGIFYAINSSGSLVWSYNAGTAWSEAAPAMDYNGNIYVGNSNGYLYALGTN